MNKKRFAHVPRIHNFARNCEIEVEQTGKGIDVAVKDWCFLFGACPGVDFSKEVWTITLVSQKHDPDPAIYLPYRIPL